MLWVPSSRRDLTCHQTMAIISTRHAITFYCDAFSDTLDGRIKCDHTLQARPHVWAAAEAAGWRRYEISGLRDAWQHICPRCLDGGQRTQVLKEEPVRTFEKAKTRLEKYR
jgi:hypothetical protein